MNRYLEAMAGCIQAERGLINKFIGDAILAVFGVPLPREDHAGAAVRAAILMSRRCIRLNEELAAEGLPAIRIGVGIHTGEVLAGNIGTPERMEYTVIGDAVNVSARLESLCKEYNTQILFSESTQSLCKNMHSFVSLGHTQVKGREIPVELFKLKEVHYGEDHH